MEGSHSCPVAREKSLLQDHGGVRIMALKDPFFLMDCYHIYRQHNHLVDRLSKEALLSKLVHLAYSKHMEGELISSSTFEIFDT